MPSRRSLYAEYPDYRVDLEPNPRRVRVTIDGELIADSTRTLVVRESRLEPVLYFPIEDMEPDRLERTDHQTFCPFKGEASYWTIRTDSRAEENAVWGYEDPFDEVAGLRGYVAFYADRVDLQQAE